MDFNDGSFFLTVQKCFDNFCFKNFTVRGDYTPNTLKAMFLQQWGVKLSHQRVLHQDKDVCDGATLNELGINNTCISKLTLKDQFAKST